MLLASLARTASVTVLPKAMAPAPAKMAARTGWPVAHWPQPGMTAERQVAPRRLGGPLFSALTAAAGARRGAVEAGLAAGGGSLRTTAGAAAGGGGGGGAAAGW